MQALSFAKAGDLSALALIERPAPTPREGEALVEVKAAGLNPSDVKNVLGFFPAYTVPRAFPAGISPASFDRGRIVSSARKSGAPASALASRRTAPTRTIWCCPPPAAP